MKAVMSLSLAAIFLPASAAAAQADPAACELHVWPTKAYGAFHHGPDFAAAVTGNYAGRLSTREGIQQILGETATEAFQRDAVEELNLTAAGRFAGYRMIFHPAPEVAPTWDWQSRGFGLGSSRQVDSPSRCYAELHVHFLTHFGSTFSRRIQSTFLFRDFGVSETTFRWAYDTSSTRALGFPARSPEEAEQARLGLKAAFQQGLRDFLGSRRMRRIAREAGQ